MSDLLGLPCVHGEDATLCKECWKHTDLMCPICGWDAPNEDDLAIHLEDCEAAAEEALDDE